MNGKKIATTKLNSLADKTGEFKQKMQQLGLTGHPFNGIITIVRFFYLFIISLFGLPFALMTAIGNVLPFILAKNLGRKIAGNDISLIPAARLMSGLVIYILYYSILFIFVGIFLNISISSAIILFLLCGGYLTLWYWEILKAFTIVSRKIYYWLMDKKMISELIRLREKILIELSSFLDLS